MVDVFHIFHVLHVFPTGMARWNKVVELLGAVSGSAPSIRLMKYGKDPLRCHFTTALASQES